VKNKSKQSKAGEKHSEYIDAVSTNYKNQVVILRNNTGTVKRTKSKRLKGKKRRLADLFIKNRDSENLFYSATPKDLSFISWFSNLLEVGTLFIIQ
jgi:hypothetical protein